MGRSVSEQLCAAMNVHDIEAHVACFAEDYESEQRRPSSSKFTGREPVRENWSKLFGNIPDFAAELPIRRRGRHGAGGVAVDRNKGRRHSLGGTGSNHAGH